jgi:putative DNA primase/helicase
MSDDIYVRDEDGNIVDAKPPTAQHLRAVPEGGGQEDRWRGRLVYKNGEIVACQANAITILKNDARWRGVLVWDDFSQGIVARCAEWDVDDVPHEKEGPWKESDAIRLAAWLARHWELNLSPKQVYGAAMVVAESQFVNPPLDWLKSLVWDGTKRIDTWLPDYIGCDDTRYARLVGRYFLISAVARLFEPGCKVDTMLVLEGEQGAKKSQACRNLFGELYFTDTPLDLESKDRFVSLQGRWGLEFAELDSFRKAHSSRTKSFISSPADDFRAPYAAVNKRVKRRCVFIGSVNPVPEGYFNDETGNRRYWPILCAAQHPILLAELKRDRDQIWAEAKETYLSDPKWWPETPEEKALCNAEAEKRLVIDPWLGEVARYLDKQLPGNMVTIREILEYGLGIEVRDHDRAGQSRVGTCLGQQGWILAGRPKTPNGRERAYMRKVDKEARDKAEAEAEERRRIAEAAGSDPEAGF